MYYREAPDVRAWLVLFALLVALPLGAAEPRLLDVGVAIFDPGIPEDPASHSELGIFPRIRQAESQYLPVNLRRRLEDSGDWGVVRVMPRSGSLAELTVEGRIVESTGQRLRLQIKAMDATGRLWIQREYLHETTEADYPVPEGGDAFAGLYRQVSEDLLGRRRELDDSALREIRRVALLRYAAGLSAEAFAGYLGGGGDERYHVQRLPAQGDPMMERVQRIRNQEYLFIDNVDEQYGQLHDEMASTYALWLQYDREQSLYRQDYQRRAVNREKQGRTGSFSAMQQRYNAYRNFRIQAQDLDELAHGFDNETAPTIVETSGRVFRLTGTLENQYAEWQVILRRIFALETGLPVASQDDFAGPPQ